MAKSRASEVDVGRLCQAVRSSRRSLEPYRRERREAVRAFAGNHYGDHAAKEKVPLNLLSLYVQIVSRSLIAKNPRVMLSTFDRGLKAPVSAMESWANRQIEKLYLADTLQRVVVDALFSVGVLKVSLATPSDASNYGWNTKAGTPFAEPVDLDDLVFDLRAKNLHEPSFVGHRYRVPLDSVKDSSLYARSRKDLTASENSPYNVDGDERIARLGQGDELDGEDFEDMVDLWEIYLPRRRLVLTLSDAQVGDGDGRGEPLRVQEWLGPDCGPYHWLALGLVPGNAMPRGPILDLLDLHEATNRLYRKAMRQGERQKEVLLVAGGAMEDGSRIQEATDGEIIRCDNPDRAKAALFGGANQGNLALAIHFKDVFSWMAGNLDIMGGLSAQSKTATQDRMLNENSSRAIADMQDRVVTFTAKVLDGLCWYWWHDPFTTMRTTHALPGMPDLSIRRQVTPQQRAQGKFEDLDIKVDPYSMQHQTPSSRLAALSQVIQQIVLPALPLLREQGITLDLNAYLAKVARYADMPDLGEIVTITEPPRQEGQEGSPQAPGMPAQTERRYVRDNMTTKTRQGQDQVLINSLLGGNPQQAEMNGVPSTNGSY